MAYIKTAISLRQTLFREADAMARRMGMPRSQLFAKALQEFIERHRNRQLLERINRAYDDFPDAAEREVQFRIKARQRERLRGQW
jgi:metal-responsive CopG/Arc/MetJ family transcriptional regulator